MGLAASQARLLTITARLADNELRSQTINNAKMRLATQSAQASDEYVSALNNAQLMFTNTNENGLSQTQPLTFNTLTQYSQYNNQYGLVNSSGQALVSEEDAKMFEANRTSLEGFLKAHGLEWETTYFDETSGDLVDKLQNFYSGEYQYIGDLFNGMDNKDLKNLYLDAISEEASIETVNYSTAARNYYNQIVTLKDPLYADFREEIFGSSTSGTNETDLINIISNLSINDAQKELINGYSTGDNPIKDDTDGGAKFAINYLETHMPNVIKAETLDYLKNLLNSIKEVNDNTVIALNPTQMQGVSAGTGTYYTNSSGATAPYNLGTTFNFSFKYVKDDKEKTVTFTIGYNQETWSDTGDTYTDSNGTTHQCKQKTGEISYIYATTIDSDGNSVPNEFTFDGDPIDQTTAQDANSGKGNLDGIPFSNVDQINTVFHKITGPNNCMLDCISGYLNDNNKYNVALLYTGNKTDILKIAATEYLNAILNTPGAFNAFEYLKITENEGIRAAFNNVADMYEIYGIDITYPDEANLLLDFDKLIKTKNSDKDSDGNLVTNNDITLNNSNMYLKSVIGTYMVEKMVDVLGEPKYTWVDKSLNPAVNPDSKAQWLSNLFNRMQKGYKVLENGLANSKEWLEYAFESGLVTMEQVDLSYNWVSLDYKACANINEDTDNSTLVAKAEAKYNRAMNDIKQKDSLYDLQLKNIDTEHSSLQTEYDVIKGVISKNIDRTMKFDQSA